MWLCLVCWKTCALICYLLKIEWIHKLINTRGRRIRILRKVTTFSWSYNPIHKNSWPKDLMRSWNHASMALTRCCNILVQLCINKTCKWRVISTQYFIPLLKKVVSTGAPVQPLPPMLSSKLELETVLAQVLQVTTEEECARQPEGNKRQVGW